MDSGAKACILKDFDAALFDMDGTLIDSMWVWKDIDRKFLGERGFEDSAEVQKAIEGLSFHKTAVYFKSHFSLSESVEEIKDIWNNMAYEVYARDIALKPGAAEFLDYCADRGIGCAIATSNSPMLVEACLKNLGIYDKFGSIRTTLEVKNSKPAPDIYFLTADDLKTPYERCIVFEDIIAGIEAGRAAGMRVCAVEDDYSLPDTARKKALADYYIRDFRELLRPFGALEARN